MERTILVYGHGDRSDDGFRRAENIEDYIAGGVFRECDGRYRYSQTKNADIIVLSLDGLAYGHFEIDSMEVPTDADRKEYPPVKKVYRVRKSVRYGEPVRLFDLGISGYQFGKCIDEEEFSKILRAAGDTKTYDP